MKIYIQLFLGSVKCVIRAFSRLKIGNIQAPFKKLVKHILPPFVTCISLFVKNNIDNLCTFVYNKSNKDFKEYVMALFNRGGKNVVMSERDRMIQKHNVCRSNLLFLVVFTLVNMVFVICKSETYFLFSASIPYLLTVFGALLGGETFLSAPVFYIMVSLAVIILVVYLLCWIFSKSILHG